MTINEKIELAYSQARIEAELTFLQSKDYATSGTATEADYQNFFETYTKTPNPETKGSDRFSIATDKNKELVNLFIRKVKQVPDYPQMPNGYREAADIGYIDLDDYKEVSKEQITSMSFNQRRSFLPDYKLENRNASYPIYNMVEGELIKSWHGHYDEAICLSYDATIEAFRTESYRLFDAIDEATTLDEVDNAVATANFPTEIVT